MNLNNSLSQKFHYIPAIIYLAFYTGPISAEENIVVNKLSNMYLKFIYYSSNELKINPETCKVKGDLIPDEASMQIMKVCKNFSFFRPPRQNNKLSLGVWDSDDCYPPFYNVNEEIPKSGITKIMFQDPPSVIKDASRIIFYWEQSTDRFWIIFSGTIAGLNVTFGPALLNTVGICHFDP